MTDIRHPDIETYVKNRSLEEIQVWLQSHAENLQTLSSKGFIHELSMQFHETA